SLIGSPAFLATAYYSTGTNRVYVYSGFLQPPLYYENGSLASKFGALGWIISHEIMHGIGIQGVLYDENWNKRTSYDALMSSTLIHLKAVCLSHQYVSYNYTNLKAFRTDTQEEMLADNDGLKASYHNTHPTFFVPLELGCECCIRQHFHKNHHITHVIIPEIQPKIIIRIYC
ncbi:unnamed protein product, partial [Schistosoma mattheei]